MAFSGSNQALSAAFLFGILLQAALGALLVYWNGHGSSVFQDGRRLVLVLFLIFAALWALIDFLNLVISPNASTICQIGLIFSTTFDQLARVVLEQFLLWSVGHGTKLTAARVVLQVILVVRVVAGGILAGFTRPQFAPVCVAHTSLFPVSIVVLALDGIIIGTLLIQAMSLGLFRDMSGQSSDRKAQSKSVVFMIFGFAFWTGMSVPMLLGLRDIILFLRTALPAIALTLLVGLVLAFQNGLVSSRIDEAITPEAQSPFMNPMPPTREILRDDVNVDGSPIAPRGYTKNGLFVVNPSATPQESPARPQFGNSKNGGEMRVREVEINESSSSTARNAPGFGGSNGVFPSLATAPLPNGFSQLSQTYSPDVRPSTNGQSVPAPTSQQKKSLFSRSKPEPKLNVRALGISRPVMVDADGYSGPRMQTVDLATAAASERERRQAASARSRLVADGPAPRPPFQTLEDGLRKSVSVKRKEMGGSKSRGALSPIPSSNASAISSMLVNGTSTSASISPGRDEVRRRSPRSQTAAFDEKVAPRPTLEMKQTIGLPGNPRSRMDLAREAAGSQPQTVMLMKDIVYDNPSVVKTIIDSAPNMYTDKRPKTAGDLPTFFAPASRPKTAGSTSVFSDLGGLNTSGSIMHRPRPIKRGSSKDDTNRVSVFFGGVPSPHHRRSKSHGSMNFRKSTLYNSSGSPEELPPLPKPPTTAAALTRLLPNDTQSMSFDEKIEFLFPAPPGVSLANRRRSSVPSLPRVPSVFLGEGPVIQSPNEVDGQSSRASKRSTLNFGTQASYQQPQIPSSTGVSSQSLAPEPSRFSSTTFQTMADDITEAWLPELNEEESNMEDRERNSIRSDPRRSSAVFRDVRRSVLSEATTIDTHSHGGDTTFWGSVHSPAPAIDISAARARPTIIGGDVQPETSLSPKPLRPAANNGPVTSDRDGEFVTIGIESEENRYSFVNIEDGSAPSVFLESDEPLSKISQEQAYILENGTTWHRRIGDDLPTFSERRNSVRSTRKMPPPTPLLLNSRKQASVIVRQAEPSPEADAEERALKEIQDQLQRFEEEPTRDSVGSLLRRIPDSEAANDGMVDDSNDRLRLLENLEAEMSQQENQWQQLHEKNFDRDSIMTPVAPFDISTDLSRNSSIGSSRPPSRGVSRRARIRGTMASGIQTQQSPSTSSSDSSRASAWQQRLAEAQLEYMENAPALLRKKSLNFLDASKVRNGSVSTDSEVEEVKSVETERQLAHRSLTQEAPSLWQVALPSPTAAMGRLWNASFEPKSQPMSPEPPAKDVRPRQRQITSSLELTSKAMWAKPASAPHSRPVVALWGSKLVRPVSIKTRPLTQKPARRSRRTTFLPDIIESPQPLPNQRETLGIFQFPWGERSDNAVYKPAFNPDQFAAPAINSRLEARSRELEPEIDEYSASFFDDFEDEDDSDLEEEVEAESDDDFDETTLWHIASLLKTENVPSKNSLLPPPLESIEQYDDDVTDFDSESEDEMPVTQSFMVKFPIEPLSRSSTQSAPRSLLWDDISAPSSPIKLVGLPQPELSLWRAYLPTDNVLRSIPRVSNDVPELKSYELWHPTALAVPTASDIMWGGKPEAAAPKAATLKATAPKPSVWVPSTKAESVISEGLFAANNGRTEFRSSKLTAAAVNMTSKPRKNLAPAPQLTTRRLWNRRNNLVYERDWISESSVRPTSPSMDSLPSSGRSSPTSETASLRTTSTKASSIWSSATSIRTAVNKGPAVDRKSQSPKDDIPRSRLPSPAEEKHAARFQAKLPVHQEEPHEPARPQSKGFAAARSMFEAKASAIPPPPVNKFWQKPTAAAAAASKLPVKAVPKAERPRRRRIATTPADWDRALDEAIRAGTPKVTIVRRVTAPSEWDSALARAISLSKTRIARPRASVAMWDQALTEALAPKTSQPEYNPAALHPVFATETLSSTSDSVKPEYDPAVLHPVFFTKNLTSRSSDIHPAALGHFVNINVPKIVKPEYDPAVLHPVFFTKNLTSRSSDVHPAASGHIIKRMKHRSARVADWESALAQAISASKPKRPQATPASWEAALTEAIALSKSEELAMSKVAIPTLPTGAPTWMADEMFKLHRHASVGEISAIPRAIPPVEEPKLPNSVEVVAQPSEEILAPVWVAPIPAPGELPEWKKDEIFKEQYHSSATVAQTWVAPVDTKPANAPGTLAQTEIFANLKSDSVKRVSTSRPAELPRLSSSELFRPTSKSISIANWIMASSASSAIDNMTWVAPCPNLESKGVPGALATRDLFTELQVESVKRVTTARQTSLPVLQSMELFKPAVQSKTEINWILASSAVNIVQDNAVALEKSVVPAEITAPEEEVLAPVFTLPSKAFNRASTWIAPSPARTATVFGTVATTEMFANVNMEHVRKPVSSRPVAISGLESTKLFQPATTVEGETNWLRASMVPATSSLTRSMTWVTPPKATKKTIPGTLATTDLFTHEAGIQIMRASAARPATRPAALPRLLSSQLFTPVSKLSEEVNWLKRSSTSPQTARSLVSEPEVISMPALSLPSVAKSQTWVAPTTQVKNAAPGTLANTEMFTNIIPAQTKRASSLRSVALPRLSSQALFQSSPRASTEVNWLKRSSSIPQPVRPLISEPEVVSVPALSLSSVAKSQTWVAPITQVKNAAPGTLANTEMFTNIIPAQTKRASTLRSVALPRLSSQALFQSSPRASTEVNWLKRSSRVTSSLSSQTWTAPHAQAKNAARGTLASTDMFTDISSAQVTRTPKPRPTALPHLFSMKLFENSPRASAEVDWLKRSSMRPTSSLLIEPTASNEPTSSEPTSSRIQTWIAPQTQSSKAAPGTLAATELFTGLNSSSAQIKRASSMRPAALPRLNSTQLFVPTAVSENEVNWLHMSSYVVPFVLEGAETIEEESFQEDSFDEESEEDSEDSEEMVEDVEGDSSESVDDLDSPTVWDLKMDEIEELEQWIKKDDHLRASRMI
ncbi:hypothetical protein BP6252_10077 [Coleophoma cylindrospora]|uniref:Uncharacterized protein n=1 Tax=Coleophoma cylindrospora TaxID=1849047 RepID=A0A3D8QXB9_9HELO|nr:hypothetical protein BP6252_10077 [Coleophoma cylindrospora]